MCSSFVSHHTQTVRLFSLDTFRLTYIFAYDLQYEGHFLCCIVAFVSVVGLLDVVIPIILINNNNRNVLSENSRKSIISYARRD
jgi:hypothetical protein